MEEDTILEPEEILEVYREIWERDNYDGVDLPVFNIKTLENLCTVSIENLEMQSAYIEVGYPINIVGDLHGNIYDLLRVFKLFGVPPDANYLFLGDYVDRGLNSIDVIVLLLALFCCYPIEVTLLRGNHEFPHINKSYGFYSECLSVYNSQDVYRMFNDVFAYLPLVCVVNEEIFCVHGGISPRLKSLVQIQEIDLPIRSYDKNPLISDLVWSDPTDKIDEYEKNYRGSGFIFGHQACERFLIENNLKLIVRAHQCVLRGIHSFGEEMCITVFTASNYGGVMRNRSGIMRYGNDKRFYFYSMPAGSMLKQTAKAILCLDGAKLGLQFPTHKMQSAEYDSYFGEFSLQNAINYSLSDYNSTTQPQEGSEEDQEPPRDGLKFLREDKLLVRIIRKFNEINNYGVRMYNHRNK